MSGEAIAPGGTLGILGGGQLGRMLALAAAQLGLKVHVFAPDADSPAFDVAAARTCRRLSRTRRRSSLSPASVDAVTYEFENVPAAAARDPAAPHAPPASEPARLATTQDRLAEKTFVAGLGIADRALRGGRRARRTSRAGARRRSAGPPS